MYWVAGLPAVPIQNVSVLAASGASRSSVVCTVAPSGTTAIAASAAATCASSSYVEPCHRVLSGNWKASATVTAAIIAAPCLAVPDRAARATPRTEREPAEADAGQARAEAPRHRLMPSAAAMNRIGMIVAL